MRILNRPLLWASALVACAPALGQSGATLPSHRGRALAPVLSLTGSYYGPNQATLDVLELPGGRIKFSLLALSRRLDHGAPNTGEADGVLPLRGGVAVYRFHGDADTSDGDYSSGKMVMRFQKGRVFVFQQGDVGFGQGVSASGTYVRHSRKPPKFSKDGSAI